MWALKSSCCLQAVFALSACRATTPCDVGAAPPASAPGKPSAPISDAPFAHPSQFVSLGQRRIHLRCMGAGSPTIVLEAGLGGDSSSWVFVQPRLAASTRVCSYDRAGYYFSDPGPMPRTADADVDDLHRTLEAASIRGPFLIVGHSLGGLLVRLYAAKYPADVIGMVLLDPSLDNVEDVRSPKASDQGEENPLHVKCLAAAQSGTITSDAKLKEDCIGPPDKRLSSELNAAQTDASTRVTNWETVLSEGKEMRSGRTGERVRAAPERLENLPLVVMTKGKLTFHPDWETKVVQEYYGRFVQRHAETAARSKRGLHLVSPSGHQMPMDVPDLVVSSVRAVLAAYRENGAVAP
jgi:pimeloyl-ACP methyl ester carboxylesterase